MHGKHFLLREFTISSSKFSFNCRVVWNLT